MIKIVTDSTADLPESVCEQYGIEVVPLYINFGDKTYREITDLSKNEFYEKLKEFEPKGIPTTSQPTPKDFMDTYDKSFVGAGSEPVSAIILIAVLR